MDTVEELNGTYFYNGMINLTASELFFWVFMDTVNHQLGWGKDLTALASIILGQPILKTRGKFHGSTKGTSIASVLARRHLNLELPFHLPTFTNATLRTMKPTYVKNLGAFVGRTIPVVGWVIVAADVSSIAYKSTTTYNRIVREGDKLW
ncbi:STM2901 family protein [Pantoea sp. A4]|jgi:hypothetical protein|uniref:STM2901 family protein n=1 Tax=Pantoea sp. A4 TaxID=1225184 RepID=UPI00038077EA|nr:hypothetical protein [Pantoea sp. A4]